MPTPPRRALMLYYVKTGDIDTSTDAKSHRHAAVKTLRFSNEKDLGLCVIVSEQQIVDENSICFLTDCILMECRSSSMRVVT